MELEKYKHVGIDPEMLGGQPYLKGTRLSVAFVLSCLPQGMSVKEISDAYIPVTSKEVLEVLQFAAEVLDAWPVACLM
jgi:uncharacterized protein (DUF433 family)